MNDSPQAASVEAPSPDLSGIEECFHPVVLQYGRELFAFVYNMQMGQQAANVLATLAQHSRNGQVLKAVQVLASVISEMADRYVERTEWTPELIAQCSRDAEQAFASKLVVPPAIIVPRSH